MIKTPKNLMIIFFLLILIVSFANYADNRQDIDSLSYAMAIAIDVGTTAKYKISLQLSTIESSASEAAMSSSQDQSSGGSGSSSESSGSGSGSSSQYLTSTVETDSLENAFNLASTLVNKDIDLSNCKVLVISEDIARQGIGDIINSLINKIEVKTDCNLIVSRIAPNEFEQGKEPKLEKMLTKFYDVTSNVETRKWLFSNCNIT